METDDDIDYCDVIHMIAYDHDNLKIAEEIADEMVEKNPEESGEDQTTTEIEGNTEFPE